MTCGLHPGLGRAQLQISAAPALHGLPASTKHVYGHANQASKQASSVTIADNGRKQISSCTKVLHLFICKFKAIATKLVSSDLP